MIHVTLDLPTNINVKAVEINHRDSKLATTGSDEDRGRGGSNNEGTGVGGGFNSVSSQGSINGISYKVDPEGAKKETTKYISDLNGKFAQNIDENPDSTGDNSQESGEIDDPDRV